MSQRVGGEEFCFALGLNRGGNASRRDASGHEGSRESGLKLEHALEPTVIGKDFARLIGGEQGIEQAKCM